METKISLREKERIKEGSPLVGERLLIEKGPYKGLEVLVLKQMGPQVRVRSVSCRSLQLETTLSLTDLSRLDPEEEELNYIEGVKRLLFQVVRTHSVKEP